MIFNLSHGIIESNAVENRHAVKQLIAKIFRITTRAGPALKNFNLRIQNRKIKYLLVCPKIEVLQCSSAQVLSSANKQTFAFR